MNQIGETMSVNSTGIVMSEVEEVVRVSNTTGGEYRTEKTTFEWSFPDWTWTNDCIHREVLEDV